MLASANEQDEDAPLSDEELLRNIARPNGWYTRVRDSLSAIAPLFVISFIRAVYGDKLFSYNPDRRPEYGEEPIPFAAGPIDAVTAYCLASNHELLNCPMLARWYRNLHTNVRARAIDTLHDAVPEEMAIPTKPKGGAPPGQARLWRLNLAEVCGQALRASGWIIQPGTPCGPVPTPQALAAFSAHYLRQRDLEREQQRRQQELDDAAAAAAAAAAAPAAPPQQGPPQPVPAAGAGAGAGAAAAAAAAPAAGGGGSAGGGGGRRGSGAGRGGAGGGAGGRSRGSGGGGAGAGGAGLLMSMMLYLHVSCYFGVFKVGETGDSNRGKGQSTSTFFTDVLSYCLRIRAELLGTSDPRLAEQRAKLYEKLLLKYLKRFLLNDRREVRAHVSVHARAHTRARAHAHARTRTHAHTHTDAPGRLWKLTT